MLKIILCDDDSFSLQVMADLLKTAIQKGNYQAELSCLASNGKELLGFMKKTPYPYLYFIDFDLGKGELNGIDVAHLILKQDPDAKIIFVTSHTDKGIDILKSGVRAYGFIEKNPEKQIMVQEYMKYLNMIQPDFVNPTKPDCIQLSMGLDESVTLPLSQITYVDPVKTIPHFICYHTFDGSEITVRETIEHALQMLGSGFIKSHRSVIVNKSHVVDLKNGVLKLSNGCLVSYSISKKKQLMKECFPSNLNQEKEFS